MDPDNDMDDEGEDILVKEIATSRKPGRSAQTNQMDWDMIQVGKCMAHITWS